jgi:hypothetical protein
LKTHAFWKYPNILMPVLLTIIFIIYTYDIYIVKKQKSELKKMLLLNIYNGRDCNVIYFFFNVKIICVKVKIFSFFMYK